MTDPATHALVAIPLDSVRYAAEHWTPGTGQAVGHQAVIANACARWLDVGGETAPLPPDVQAVLEAVANGIRTALDRGPADDVLAAVTEGIRQALAAD